MTEFLVIDAPSVYNVIMGRPMIHEIQGVVSTYHQMMIYVSDAGYPERIEGSQKEARRCNYLKPSTSRSKDDDDEDEEEKEKEKEPSTKKPKGLSASAQGSLAKEKRSEKEKAGSSSEPNDSKKDDDDEDEEEKEKEKEPSTKKPKGLSASAQGSLAKEKRSEKEKAGSSSEPNDSENQPKKKSRTPADVDSRPDDEESGSKAMELDQQTETVELTKGDAEKCVTIGMDLDPKVRVELIQLLWDNRDVKEDKDHVKDLAETFATLRKHQLKLNPKKCIFGVKSGKFLGFMVNKRGIDAGPAKVQAALDLPEPKTKGDVQRLTERMASLSRFISRASDKGLPFFKALKLPKTKELIWGDKQKEAFKQLREPLAQLPTLAHLAEGETLYLYVDVSPATISAVLLREKDKVQQPIYFVSHTLTDAETRFPLLKKVAYAVVVAARKLRPYFDCHQIAVLTD
ncbi:cylicin-2-like [Chenopodium quinoa]|uniref:cylicin-2-like n=1 Tax=Chenopodium quinoa TaxID=63459 RepID=UPI000B780F7B|nr:cylicin-2-like [Chenopodium quinoa]